MTTQEQWEKEFDERYDYLSETLHRDVFGDLKSYIRTNFIPRSTVLEEIERREKDVTCTCGEAFIHEGKEFHTVGCGDYEKIYNQALNDLKQALITNSKEV